MITTFTTDIEIRKVISFEVNQVEAKFLSADGQIVFEYCAPNLLPPIVRHLILLFY